MAYRQHTKLADGRDLYYFDLEPGQDRSAPDTRELPETATSSQIRWDPLFSEWAVIAGHRQSRTYKPPTDLCPLDPSSEGKPTEIPASDYDVVVFENRFPSLSTDAGESFSWIEEFPFKSGPGAGRCEVVCFTPNHNMSFDQLDDAHARLVIDALADRTAELSQIPTVEYVFCFENRGEAIGVTLSHPHGQIYGYPFVPPRMERAAQTAEDYRREHDGACLRCELLAREVEAGVRVVTSTEHWTALVPFAARWPYEVRIIANRHVADLPSLDDAERDDLARIYLDVLRRFDGLFDNPAPYIAGWHQAPVRKYADSWHLGAEIFTIQRANGKLKYLAGSESGAAVWVNDVSPETAAARLRGEDV